MSKPEFWDKEALYDEHISPLVTQVIALCKKHGIPVAATFQYANHEDNGPAFCTTVIPADDQSERMREIGLYLQPRRPYAHAETHVTNPDGSKVITIRRIS